MDNEKDKLQKNVEDSKEEPKEKTSSQKIEKPKESSPKVPPKKKKPLVKKSPVITPQENYVVTSSPHIFSQESTSKIMWTVSLCLAPAGLASIWIFGLRSLMIIALSISGAVGAEYIWQKAWKRKITISDGSAFLTGLLLAYNLSPNSAWWIPLLGSIFAIIIVKQLFGGLGMNIFNPALAARGFLLSSFPSQLTTWTKPVLGFSINAITGPTPLDLLKRSTDNPQLIQQLKAQFPQIGKMFSKLLWGLRGGCIGETCAILLILGGLYLIYKKYIDWQIPAVYIGTVALFMLIFGGGREVFQDPLSTVVFHVFSGGLILGAFYMATDYVTIPATIKGRMIFALGCGILTGIIRMWGGYPEGVCYSILIMNAFVPLIDSKTKPRVYGTQKELQSA